jgi:hypothetical protein
VAGAAFNQDGTRLASGSHDGTVKLWNPESGQELFTLDGHAREVTCVTFSPDGSRLAWSGTQGALLLADARPLTADRRDELEARSLVEFLLAQRLQKSEVAARLTGNQTISKPVCQRALDLLDQYWRHKGRAEALISPPADTSRGALPR